MIQRKEVTMYGSDQLMDLTHERVVDHLSPHMHTKKKSDTNIPGRSTHQAHTHIREGADTCINHTPRVIQRVIQRHTESCDLYIGLTFALLQAKNQRLHTYRKALRMQRIQYIRMTWHIEHIIAQMHSTSPVLLARLQQLMGRRGGRIIVV